MIALARGGERGLAIAPFCFSNRAIQAQYDTS